MKKILALFFSVLMLLSFTSCDEGQNLVAVDTYPSEGTQEVDKVAVPDVVGMSASDAMDRISSGGLTYSISEVEDESVQAGYVVSQSPVGDKMVMPQSEVIIYIAKKDAVPVVTDPEEVYLYCAATDFVTLREVPARSGAKILEIKSREKVKYLNTNGEFYCVEYKGKTGYVLAEFMSSDPKAPLNDGTGNLEIKPNDILYCRASGSATLRETPSRAAKGLAAIKRYEEVTYHSTKGEFFYVTYRGTKGYVLADYFSPEYNAPANTGVN